MAAPFSRTLRSLGADRSRASVVALVACVLVLGPWCYWFFGARVSVYEATPDARLEVGAAAHPIQAPFAGRVVVTRLALGRRVVGGEILVELDSQAEGMRLGESRARLEALAAERTALRRELAAQKRARVDDRQGLPAALGEARALYEQAEAAAALAEHELDRTRRLHRSGGAPESEVARADAELRQRRAAADALRLAVGRTEWSRRAEGSDRLVEAERLEREIAVLDGEELAVRATVARLEHEIAMRTIRATVTGRLAEVAPVTPGSVVQEGERLGAIVPSGDLRIVAQYPPPAAFGRIRRGQRATLRLDGFPWAQYGTVSARVTHVASEVRDGRVRVELAIVRKRSSRIPLEHGLPGSVEIEVERASPAELVLRAAGKALDTRDPPAPEP